MGLRRSKGSKLLTGTALSRGTSSSQHKCQGTTIHRFKMAPDNNETQVGLMVCACVHTGPSPGGQPRDTWCRGHETAQRLLDDVPGKLSTGFWVECRRKRGRTQLAQ